MHRWWYLLTPLGLRCPRSLSLGHALNARLNSTSPGSPREVAAGMHLPNDGARHPKRDVSTNVSFARRLRHHSRPRHAGHVTASSPLGNSPVESRRAPWSNTSPRIPFRRRASATDHSIPAGSPIALRADSVTRTVPAGAALVTRLARLTGLPYQSRARLTAGPNASPTRSRGKSSAAAASTRSITVTSSLNGSEQTSIT